MLGKIEYAQGLTKDELEKITELERACSNYEKLHMKLNWDMLENRPAAQKNDFLYYEGEQLVGFLGMYNMDQMSIEVEITGMVHPDYRRRGIFKELFDAAKQECTERAVKRILLICERSSVVGKGFVEYTGAKYVFSEYRMSFEQSIVMDCPKNGIELRKAEHKDTKEIKELDAVGFGISEEEIEDREVNVGSKTIYLAQLNGKNIGKIGALIEGEIWYVFGFVIRPEYRRKGYGREVLSLLLSKLTEGPMKSVILEVAVENEKALSLYKSCGFQELTVYDYYEL